MPGASGIRMVVEGGGAGVWHSSGRDTDENPGTSLAFSSNFPSTMGLPCVGYAGDFTDFTAEPGHNQGWLGFERFELDLNTLEPTGFAPTSWSVTFNLLANNTRATDVCLLLYSYDTIFAKSYVFSGDSFSIGTHTIGGALDGSTRVIMGMIVLYGVAGPAAPIAFSLANFYATSGGGGGGGSPDTGLVGLGNALVFGVGALTLPLIAVWGTVGMFTGKK